MKTDIWVGVNCWNCNCLNCNWSTLFLKFDQLSLFWQLLDTCHMCKFLIRYMYGTYFLFSTRWNCVEQLSFLCWPIHEAGQKSWERGRGLWKILGGSKKFMKFYNRFVKILRVGQKLPKLSIFWPNLPIFGFKMNLEGVGVSRLRIFSGGGVKAKHPPPPWNHVCVDRFFWAIAIWAVEPSLGRNIP